MINKRVTSAVVMQNSARKERLFSQLISSTCCYISADGVVTGFHQTDQRAWSLCDTKAVKPVCVIARHFYLEFQQSYPIESLRDLKAVLAQQYPADCLHMIGDAQFGKRTVQTIQFKPELAQYLPVFAVLLPESVVIASAIEDDFFSARIDFWQSWFLARNAAGVCSRQSSPLLQDHFSFKLLAGVPEKTAEYNFDKATVPALLVAGLARLPLRTLPFRVKVRTQFASLPDWRQLLAATTLIVGSHMAATQAFLSWQLQATRSNIAALGADVDRLMTAQQQLQDVAASLGVLSNYSAQQASAIYYFELLKLCIEQHVTVRAIRLEQQQLLLSATATNAVEVLLLLQKQPWVESANFVSGTVKNDTGEQFSVRIMLKQGGLHE